MNYLYLLICIIVFFWSLKIVLIKYNKIDSYIDFKEFRFIAMIFLSSLGLIVVFILKLIGVKFR
jgi:hypothetical protein